MDWSKFEAERTRLPEEVVKAHFEGFSAATQNNVDINILEIAARSRIGSSLIGDFQFKIVLTSEALPSYSFTVFRFAYDVTLYPVKIDPDKDIFRELFPEEKSVENKVIISASEKSFEEMIIKILGSEKFKSVVIGIMRLAEKRGNA